MNRTLIFMTVGLVYAGAMTLALVYGHTITVADQKPVYEALRNVSAIIFGVLGAWIALLYPGGLKRVFAGSKSSTYEAEQIKCLFRPMRYATIIVAVSLLFEVGLPVARQVAWLRLHANIVRTASFVLLVLLVCTQLWSLLLALLPVERAESQIDKATEGRRSLDRRTGRTQEKKPDDVK